MWAQLLKMLGGGASSGAGGGLDGLMNVGQNTQGVMGDQGLGLMGGNAPPSAMDSLGSGIAPELGGAPAGSNPLAAMSAPSSQGGLMDMQGIMSQAGKMPDTGGKSASKYENEEVKKFTEQGMAAGQAKQQNLMDFMSYIQMMGGM